MTLHRGHKTVAHLAVKFVGLDSSASAVPYLASWAESAAPDTFERIAALVDRLARRLEDALSDASATQDPTDDESGADDSAGAEKASAAA